MKNKHLYLLSTIFILLIGLLLLKIYAPKIFPSKPSLYNEKISSINKNSIDLIEISKENNRIDLKKENNSWVLNQRKADKDKITDLLDTLLSTDKVELVAETNLKHNDFELTPDLFTKVKIGDKLTLLVGKSSLEGIYLRFEDNDSVFLLKNSNSSNFSTNPQDWYDKTILEIGEENLNKLTFQQTSTKLSLIKKDNKWYLEDDKEANMDKLNPILLTLASFKAKRLAQEQEVSSYPSEPFLNLEIEYKDGNDSLSFYKKEDEYLVQRMSDGEKFIVSQLRAEDFDISKDDLMKKE